MHEIKALQEALGMDAAVGTGLQAAGMDKGAITMSVRWAIQNIPH